MAGALIVIAGDSFPRFTNVAQCQNFPRLRLSWPATIPPSDRTIYTPVRFWFYREREEKADHARGFGAARLGRRLVV